MTTAIAAAVCFCRREKKGKAGGKTVGKA